MEKHKEPDDETLYDPPELVYEEDDPENYYFENF